MTSIVLLLGIAVTIWFFGSVALDLHQGKRALTDHSLPVEASGCIGIKNGKIAVVPCDEAFGDED